MCALQKALSNANIPCLKLGGTLRHGEIPWWWSWEDAIIAAQLAAFGFPFIMGPNVLFRNSSKPGAGPYEKELLDAESCVLQFTESSWYASLIQANCNRNEAPIVTWSYPIHPQPEGPLPFRFDILIYLKTMNLGRECIRFTRYPKAELIVYGQYNRDDLIKLARQARCCLYLSADDRGPLALAEILLCGCPCIGVPKGAPWLETPGLGVQIPHFEKTLLSAAVEKAISMDRNAVRETALQRFSTDTTVKTITAALEQVANIQFSH